MRKRIDWKFITICHSEDELDTFLDANRPTTIAKSHLTNCSLCGTKEAEAHKMRMQYLNCNSKLCGPSCEARFLVLSCDTAGKIEIYSANEHNQGQERTENGVEDHLSRKCKKIIENIMIEQSVTKPEQIMEFLQQKETEYELAVMPSLTQIRNYVRNKIQNIKNRLSLPAFACAVPAIKVESLSKTLGSFNDEQPVLNDFQSDSDNNDEQCQQINVDKSKILTESLQKIEDYLSKLEKSQSRQVLFTANYFDDIELRLRETRNKIIKEIDKSYQLFFERINYLKNKYKIDHKKEEESGELNEFKAKKEKLSAKCGDSAMDADNLDLLLNEANYMTQQLQSSLSQIDQNIASIKRIRYEPNRSLVESECLLGNLFFDEGTNKKRKLDF